MSSQNGQRVHNSKLKLRRLPELKLLIKGLHRPARWCARQNTRQGLPAQRLNGSCVRLNKHDNVLRRNKQRQLGERKLLTKKPDDKVKRESKLSRQNMLLTRWPSLTRSDDEEDAG
jgi:hypothetical protein